MTAFRLPLLPGESDQRATLSLDGRLYLIRWRWNARGRFWVFDLRTDASAPLALGLVARIGVPLIASRRSKVGMPPGEFFVVNTEGDADPTLDNFGTTCRALYVSP